MPGGRAVSRIGGAPANASLRIKLSGGYALYEPLGAPALEPYYEPWCEPLQPHNQQQQHPYDYRVYPSPRPACSYDSGGWRVAEAHAAQQPPPWQQGRLNATVQNSGAAAPPWQQQEQGYSQAQQPWQQPQHDQYQQAPWQQPEQYQAPLPWQQDHAAATAQSNPPWQQGYQEQQQPQQQAPAPWQHAEVLPPWQAVPTSSSAGSVSANATPALAPGVATAASARQGSGRGKQSNAGKVRLPTPPPDVHAQAHKQRAQQQQQVQQQAQKGQQAAQQQKQAAPRHNPAVLRQKPVLVQQALQARQQQGQKQAQAQQDKAPQHDATKAVSSNSGCGGGSPWREPLSPPPRAAAQQQKPGPGRPPVGNAAATPGAASPLLADYTPKPPSAAAATPLLADYTPAPAPTANGGKAQPASSAHTSSSTGAGPVVPDFIQRLWQEKEARQGAQQAKQAQQEPATPDALHSARPGSAAAPPPAVQPAAKLAVAPAATQAAAAATPAAAADAAAAAEQEGDVEEGELVGECASSCSREPWRESLPPPPLPPARRTQPAGSQQCSYSNSSRAGGASQARRRGDSRELYGSPSRGRQASRDSGYSRRSRASRSSCRSSSRGRRSSSSECESRRRGGRSRGYRRRRRSRSPLRRVGRSDACGKRRAPAAAAPPPADAPLALASLVESMAAEAASLQRQLGRLTMSDGAGADGKAGLAASGGSAGAAPAASASAATSQAATAVAKAADVESQLAALSSKLGQLTLCLQTMQPAAAAAGSEAGQGDRSSDSEAGRFYIVFDTNVFMDHSRMIKHDCWKTIVASGSSTTRILVPLEVVRELDGIKKCFFRGFWAQRAIRRLEGMQGHPALRGQREDERYRGLLRRNDDGILDCCLLFRSRGAQVQICSKDVNLRVRARTEGIPCCLPADVLPLLRDRLDLEALRSVKPAS